MPSFIFFHFVKMGQNETRISLLSLQSCGNTHPVGFFVQPRSLRQREWTVYKTVCDPINCVSKRCNDVDATASFLPLIHLSSPSYNPFSSYIATTPPFSLSLCSEPSPVAADPSTLCLKATAGERQSLCNSGFVREMEGGTEIQRGREHWPA